MAKHKPHQQPPAPPDGYPEQPSRLGDGGYANLWSPVWEDQRPQKANPVPDTSKEAAGQESRASQPSPSDEKPENNPGGSLA